MVLAQSSRPALSPAGSGRWSRSLSRSARPPTRTSGGQILYVEDFRAVQIGLWNDGVGWAGSDTDIMFGGKPTMRLDTGGNSNGGPANPNRTAITSGVVVKRRVHDGYGTGSAWSSGSGSRR